MVKYYLNLKDEADRLKVDLTNFSDKYIREHSLTKSAINNFVENYQEQSIDVFNVVCNIIHLGRASRKRYNRINKRYNLFAEEFSEQELSMLRKDLYRDLELLKKACRQVNEVDYYLTHHGSMKMDKRLMRLDDVKELNDLEDELELLFGDD